DLKSSESISSELVFSVLERSELVLSELEIFSLQKS
ncbi:hypothetical protein A2U01_0063474, partial [Trifolium medium]|nr:hypothetical protein [Trifolium medium]